MVLLEVQMHAKPGFKHRLFAQTAFVDGVIRLSLEELGQQADLDPLLALLSLPVRPGAELPASTQQILEHRPDVLSTVLTIMFERFPTLTPTPS